MNSRVKDAIRYLAISLPRDDGVLFSVAPNPLHGVTGMNFKEWWKIVVLTARLNANLEGCGPSRVNNDACDQGDRAKARRNAADF